MSGLDKIIEEIQKDSESSASQLVKEATEKAEKLSSEARAELEEKNKIIQKDLEVKKTAILERAKSSAELEKRKIILSKKISLLENALNQAKESLSKLPDEEYFELLIKLTNKYAEKEQATMNLSKYDLQRLPSDFESKLPSNIKLSKDQAKIQNGFILVFDGIDINCSFDALFSDKIEELHDVIASILFK